MFDEKTEALIWSTKRYEDLMLAMDTGERPKMTPFYEGNPIIRKGNIIFDYTEFEISEMKKCINDIKYFANNYCTVMTDEGLQTIILRDYQEDMLDHFVNERFSIVLASRQIGKTICSSIYIAWFVLFSFDKNVLVLSNKGATTREIVDKTKVILESLPFFMKPGTVKNDVFNMKFDNGCRIVAQSTTKKAGIGFTIHLLFLDEFAHIHQNFVNSFYENVFPTLSSSKISKIIITSTPSGFNKFHDIYKAAIEGKNEFKPFRVDWWQVPDRDDAWMHREIGSLGSLDAFNRQYGNMFVSSDNLLLSPDEVKKIQKIQTEFNTHNFPELDDIDIEYERFLKFHPSFDIEEAGEDTNFWAFSIDIAEGVLRDYSIINIFKIEILDKKNFKHLHQPGTISDFFALKQVGIFRSNEHNIEDFSKILYTLTFDIFYAENIKMIIEWNNYGGELLKNLQTIFPQRNEFDEELVVKFKHRIDSKVAKFGLKVKNDNKGIMCQKFRKYIRENRMIISEYNTVEEAKQFGRMPTGIYKALKDHDDIIMTCINVSEFFGTMDYSDFIEEIQDLLEHDIIEGIEDEIDKGTKGDGSMYFDIYELLNDQDTSKFDKNELDIF